MGMFDFLKSKKRRDEEAAARETDCLMRLDDAALSDIEPSETRFTQEYRDFLAAQEDAGERAEAQEERPESCEADDIAAGGDPERSVWTDTE